MNNKKIVVIMSLLGAIVIMALGFTILGSKLTINGTGKVKSSTWNVHFVNLSSGVIVGEAVINNPPTISSTNISDLNVSLWKLNDSVTYTFDVENKGSYDAKIGSIKIDTPNCTGTGTNAKIDATSVCDNLSYTLTYANGSTVNKDDILGVNEKRQMILTVSNNTTESKSDVSISNLDITIIYLQV